MRRRGLLLAVLAALAVAPTLAFAQSVEPSRADDRTTGAADAPVTLTVYMSTTCSHCAHWHTADFPAFKTKYVDTGQVKVVYRDLPTPPQRLAVAGAAMARCAPADRYEDVLDALFKGQATWFPQNKPNEWLIEGGSAGGLTLPQMQACLTPENLAASEARGQRSAADGVDSTPTFFVNGREVSTGHDVAAFSAVIDPLLAGR